jgi:hypothetical protein
MAADLLDFYDLASGWTADKVRGALDQFDAPTPCDGRDVRTLLDHMLETQRFFIASACGEGASPPSSTPPRLLSDDPVGGFEQGRAQLLAVFGDPDVLLAHTGRAPS